MSKRFRHGFKAEAERYSLEFRQDLKLEPHAPMMPKDLAEHLGVPVNGISDHPTIPDDVKEFWRSSEDPTFSGLILCDGTYKEIVHNDFHHPRRQNSNIAHEIAHILLGHPLSQAISPKGDRSYDRRIEDEAKWLGATLQLPKASLLHILLNKIPSEETYDAYGVSEQMLRYRIQVTDSFRAAQNIRRKKAYKAA